MSRACRLLSSLHLMGLWCLLCLPAADIHLMNDIECTIQNRHEGRDSSSRRLLLFNTSSSSSDSDGISQQHKTAGPRSRCTKIRNNESAAHISSKYKLSDAPLPPIPDQSLSNDLMARHLSTNSHVDAAVEPFSSRNSSTQHIPRSSTRTRDTNYTMIVQDNYATVMVKIAKHKSKSHMVVIGLAHFVILFGLIFLAVYHVYWSRT